MNVRGSIRFTIFHSLFGPYSSKLDHVIHILENEGRLDIDTSGKTHRIIMKKQERRRLSKEDDVLVDEVRKVFYNKTPMELEAITTIDYVAVTLLHGEARREDVIKQVKVIKGEKFSSQDLETGYDLLIEQGYISA